MQRSNLNPIGSPEPQTYKFEFLSDGEKYTTTFKGILSEDDIHNVLKTMQAHLYSESAEVIGMYLREHPIEYSDFHAVEYTIEHHDVMAHAACLLCCTATSWIDRVTGGTENYFSVIDHQKWVWKSVCEGCCLAVKKAAPRHGSISTYNIIGQTFKERLDDTDIQGNFEIRANNGSTNLYSVLQVNAPVIPTFGCVDMIALLMKIGHIQTREQVLQLTVR